MATWIAQPRQADFLNSDEYAVLFGGARGGGKTDALLAYGISRAIEHPGSNRLFIRRSFAQLAEVGAAIDRSQQLLHGKAHWSASTYTWTFKNGSKLKFGHLSDVSAIENYLGAQADDILIDQAEQITEDEYGKLKGSNRATVSGLSPTMRLSANPGGVGHGWVKATFIDAAPSNTRYELQFGNRRDGSPNMVSHRFVPSKVWDNQELLSRDPDYVSRLLQSGKALAQAWIEGEWDSFSGQYFSEWSDQFHVCAPFKVPFEWPRWHATDYGIADPSCTLWAARSPAGRIYVYRERYEAERTIDQQALKIRLWSGDEKYRNRVLDPSCWSREGNGRSKADQYSAAGLQLAKANNDRIAGWSKLRQLLAWTPAHSEEDIASGLMLPVPFQAPRIQIFSTCHNLIRTLPNMIHDSANPEDLKKVHGFNGDHAVDTLRYLVMSLDVQTDKRQKSSQPYEMGSRKSTYALRKRIAA